MDVSGRLRRVRRPAQQGGEARTWLRDEEATVSVPVACPIGESEAVLDGRWRTTKEVG